MNVILTYFSRHRRLHSDSVGRRRLDQASTNLRDGPVICQLVLGRIRHRLRRSALRRLRFTSWSLSARM